MVSLPHLTVAIYKVCPSGPHQVVAWLLPLQGLWRGEPESESGAHPALRRDTQTGTLESASQHFCS